MAMIIKAGWNTKDSPLMFQSFDPASLRMMRDLGLKAKAVQLIDGDDDWKTGLVTYADRSTAKPYSWTLEADPRNFDAMVTPAGLAEIKTYADCKFDQRDVNVTATTLFADAHKAGLFVHPFPFRNEASRLAATYNGDPKAELKAHFALGVDGVFTDFSDTGKVALTEWLHAIGFNRAFDGVARH
jgi:glycerophosphoryl diester phosphodiesterase